jgi:hypothetical protein
MFMKNTAMDLLAHLRREGIGFYDKDTHKVILDDWMAAWVFELVHGVPAAEKDKQEVIE